MGVTVQPVIEGELQTPCEPNTPQEGIASVQAYPDEEVAAFEPPKSGAKGSTLTQLDDSSRLGGLDLGARKHTLSPSSLARPKKKLVSTENSLRAAPTIASREQLRNGSWAPERRIDGTSVIYAPETQANLAFQSRNPLHEHLHRLIETTGEPPVAVNETARVRNVHETRKRETGVPRRNGKDIKSYRPRAAPHVGRDSWTAESIRQLYALQAANVPNDQMRYFIQEKRTIDSLKSRVYSLGHMRSENKAANIATWNEERDRGVTWTSNENVTEVTSFDGRRYGRVHTHLPEDPQITKASTMKEAAQANGTPTTKASECSEDRSIDPVSKETNLQPHQIGSSPVVPDSTLAQARPHGLVVDVIRRRPSAAVPTSFTFINQVGTAQPQPLGFISRRIRTRETRRPAQVSTSTTTPAVESTSSSRRRLAFQPSQPTGFLNSRLRNTEIVLPPQAATTNTSGPALSPYPPSNPPTPEWLEQQYRQPGGRYAVQAPAVTDEWVYWTYGAGHSAIASAHAVRVAESGKFLLPSISDE